MPEAVATPPAKPVESQRQGSPGLDNWMTKIRETPPETNVPLSAPPTPAASPAPAAAPAASPAAAPEPTKPAEAPPKDAPEDKDDPWPRTSADWKKFKENRKIKETELSTTIATLNKERDELTKKLQGLTSFQDTPEYKSIVKERDELSERLRTVEVTQHPRFKAYFENKTNAQIELAKRIVGGDKAEQVAKILQLPESEYRDNQIQEVINELSQIPGTRLAGVLNAIDEIALERSNAIAAASKDAEAIKMRETAAQEAKRAERQKNQTTFIENGIKAITDAKNGHPAFQKRDNDDAWNTAVDKRLETVKTLLTGNITPQDIFSAAVNATAYHQILSEHKGLMDENTKLKEQVKAMEAAQPKLEGGARPAGNGGAAPTVTRKPGANPMEAAKAWTDALRQSMNQGA